ncbi:MAG: hypothetical protein ACRDC3_03740 [Paraclostridium dentum]|uniref:hypothetical protein n=1 Tax=Paraclostridium dentum TaxID=2662455 RepID=UPI003EE45555
MNIATHIHNLKIDSLNEYAFEIKLDFYSNINMVEKTLLYWEKNRTKVNDLYIDLNNGHNIFEDSIRFRILKSIECLKKLFTIIRFRFYKGTNYENINKKILTAQQIQSLEEILGNRNSTAHETDAFELFALEFEFQQIKRMINEIKDIFEILLTEYEKKTNYKLPEHINIDGL